MPAMLTSPYVLTILMLLGSNVFMTVAWYGHLRFKEVPLAGVIVASWMIAFVEYCLAVPANRWGSAVYTTAQLKTIQEVITLLVFAAFSVLYLKEPMTWNYAIGFVLVAVGAARCEWCQRARRGYGRPQRGARSFRFFMLWPWSCKVPCRNLDIAVADHPKGGGVASTERTLTHGP